MKKRKRLTRIFLILFFVIGLVYLGYFIISEINTQMENSKPNMIVELGTDNTEQLLKEIKNLITLLTVTFTLIGLLLGFVIIGLFRDISKLRNVLKF